MTTLNQNQQRSIAACCVDIHRRLAELEAWLDQSKVTTAFSEYVSDLSPTEAKVLKDYFGRLRSTMLACLEENQIPLESRHTSLRWALQCGCMYVDVVLGELTPGRIAGYGKLDAAGKVAVEKLHDDMRRLVHRIGAICTRDWGETLQKGWLTWKQARPAWRS